MLNRGEDVLLVTPTSTWASPRAILARHRPAAAVAARRRARRARALARVPQRRRRSSTASRRRHATLTVRTLAGRRHVFHDLRPHTAATIEQHVLDRPTR